MESDNETLQARSVQLTKSMARYTEAVSPRVRGRIFARIFLALREADVSKCARDWRDIPDQEIVDEFEQTANESILLIDNDPVAALIATKGLKLRSIASLAQRSREHLKSICSYYKNIP